MTETQSLRDMLVELEASYMVSSVHELEGNPILEFEVAFSDETSIRTLTEPRVIIAQSLLLLLIFNHQENIESYIITTVDNNVVYEYRKLWS